MNYGCCSNCNKMIRYEKLCLCDECKAKFLHEIKEYIYANGIKSVEEIHMATAVPKKNIRYFLENDYFTSIDLKKNSEDDLDNHKRKSEEELERQLAIAKELEMAFSVKPEKKEEVAYGKPEMHFLNRAHRR